MQPINVKPAQRPDSRLVANEVNCSRHLEKMRNPLSISVRIFRGRSKPNVRVSVAPIWGKHLSNILGTLRQQLPIQLIACANQIEQIRTPFRVDLVIEYVRERSAKHTLPALVLDLK